MPHSPPTCGVCPAFADNLCHILSQASRESVPPSAVTDHTAQARRTIWREGDAVDRVPVICQGWAATSMSLSDGRRQLLSFLLPGDLVSAGLIGHTAAPCTVEAVTDVRYRSFSRATINQALTRQPDLLAVMARMLAEETARADRLAIDLGRRGAAARIANLILALTERLRKRGMMAGQTMDFPLRQHHIADAAG
ncbi:MAG TPA: Crp/Fnr family transcriptional regulator, partial [Rhizomicrobium sp.]